MLTRLSTKNSVAGPTKCLLANARMRILVHRRCRHPLVSKPRPRSRRLVSPRGQVKTLPPTSSLSFVKLAARPGIWDPADHRGARLRYPQYGSGGRTTLTLREGSLLRASRVGNLPSVVRGGNNNNNTGLRVARTATTTTTATTTMATTTTATVIIVKNN